MDDSQSAIEIPGGEEKRGFLWNMMSPNFCPYRYSSTLLLHPRSVAGDPTLIKHDPILPAAVQHKPPLRRKHTP